MPVLYHKEFRTFLKFTNTKFPSLCFSTVKGLLPPKFDTYCSYNREDHSCDIRSCHSFHINLSSNAVSHRLLTNSGVTLWNNLDDTSKNINNISSFKNGMRNRLL